MYNCPMISLGQEQRLGYKAFLILAFRRFAIGLFFLLLVFVILFFRQFLLDSVTNTLVIEGVSKASAAGTASMIMIYLTLVIFWVGVVISFFGIVIAFLEYINYTYQFNEFDLIMKKGILDRKETSIPYRQIQDMNVDRPIIYQLFGLSRLILRTAGTEEKNEHGMTKINITPIEKSTAEEIQKMLERKIGVQVVEDTVKADKEAS